MHQIANSFVSRRKSFLPCYFSVTNSYSYSSTQTVVWFPGKHDCIPAKKAQGISPRFTVEFELLKWNTDRRLVIICSWWQWAGNRPRARSDRHHQVAGQGPYLAEADTVLVEALNLQSLLHHVQRIHGRLSDQTSHHAREHGATRRVVLHCRLRQVTSDELPH